MSQRTGERTTTPITTAVSASAKAVFPATPTRRPAILKTAIVTDLRRTGDVSATVAARVAAHGNRRGHPAEAKRLWRYRPHRGSIRASEALSNQHGCSEPVF